MEVLLQHGKLVFVLVSTLISLVSLFIALKAEAKYKKLYRQYDYFMRGKDAETLEDLEEEQREMLKILHKNIRRSFQKWGIIRYNAYGGMGGNLSFALAILNYDNSGFIFNSVHAKEGGFLYIKEVEEGSTSVELGAEEKLALEEALGYRKKPQT